MLSKKTYTHNLLKLLLFITLFLCVEITFAQPALPQREITVLPTQPIDFGTFYVNAAGTIEVDYQGNVTTTGGVVSLSSTTVTPAIFEIKLCQGRTVTINYDYSVQITGSNGGQLELIMGSAKRDGLGTVLINNSEFPVEENCNFITILRAGGTLVVPANAIPGFYSGVFPMTFTQQ